MCINNNIGLKIKKLRKNLRVTQIEFAKTLNVHKSSIINYESNKRNPDSIFIKNLIDTFNVSAEWLFRNKGNMFINKNQIEYFIDQDLSELIELSNFVPEIKQVLLAKLAEAKEIFKDKVSEYEKAKKKSGPGEPAAEPPEIKAG